MCPAPAIAADPHAFARHGIERLRLLVAIQSEDCLQPRRAVAVAEEAELRPRGQALDDLYDVRGRRVVRHYDIAIGVPSAPTPNGYFKVGAPQRSSGAWGVLRRPLYRFSSSRRRASGFYIHGTSAPWAIGTWASHGCVRLYNWAIRRFSKTVPNGTLVLIRR